MPAATAPEETRMTSCPAVRRTARTSTRSRIRLASIRPSGVVNDDDPTFTTIRLAAATAARPSASRASILSLLVLCTVRGAFHPWRGAPAPRAYLPRVLLGAGRQAP